MFSQTGSRSKVCSQTGKRTSLALKREPWFSKWKSKHSSQTGRRTSLAFKDGRTSLALKLEVETSLALKLEVETSLALKLEEEQA